MQLIQIVDLIQGEVVLGENRLDMNIKYGFGSDMMSDVLAHVKEDTVLLTGLNNAQVIRTAEMLDVKAIIFVRGKKPIEEVVELAQENDIVLISTRCTLFEAAGILYQNGLPAVKV